ncbi:MAG: response regulator [Candidatus Thermoplasmatota archaeon]|nr:response regulator [Candidatus Thermoplasmatota archaeon]
MVVDDNIDLIFTVKKIFEELGNQYEIIGANSGKQCFEFLKNNVKPDLILLDIMMPEMTGWEVINQLRDNELWRNIPVVFLTARTDNTAVNAAKFLGEDYIEKPFEKDDLIRRVTRILEQKNQ